MEHLTELSRLPEKEIKEKLSKNNYIGPGSLVLYEDTAYKVLTRIGDSVFIDKPYGGNNFLKVTSDGVSPIDYHSYKKLITRKYTEGTIFKSIESLSNYFKRVLYKTYGEDRIDVKATGDYSIVTVYFPEIIIRNSLGLEHVMTDLYLIIHFKYDEYKSKTKWGFNKLWRETYTPEEVRASYMFSHISSSPGKVSSNWCYGDTEFSRYLNKCASNFNPKDIVFFIEQVKAYMQWESIEGIPHRRINDIKPYIIKDKTTKIPHNLVSMLYNKVCENLDSFSYEINTYSDDFDVSIISTQIEDITNQHIPDELKTRNVNGTSGDVKLITKDNTSLSDDQTIIFKGVEISSRIVESTTTFDINKLDEIFPKETPNEVISNITSILKNKFKEFLIKYKLEND